MAKPNYSFAKRQRDLAKKQKQEEKRLKKAAVAQGEQPAQDPADAPADEPAVVAVTQPEK